MADPNKGSLSDAEFVEELQHFITFDGILIETVAEMFNYSPSRVAGWLTGAGLPTPDEQYAILEGLEELIR